MVMLDETKDPPLDNDLPKNSARYVEFQAESEEILHESGRAGHGVGFERALADWLIKHRSQWHKSRHLETQSNRLSTA
jgi:hypothetical protein